MGNQRTNFSAVVQVCRRNNFSQTFIGVTYNYPFLDERYAHLVVTSRKKKDLFTISNMLAMCRLEHEFIGLKYYEDLCIQNTRFKKKCCKPWSLPNYIAILNNRSSCLAITVIYAVKKWYIFTKIMFLGGRYHHNKKYIDKMCPIFSQLGTESGLSKDDAVLWSSN